MARVEPRPIRSAVILAVGTELTTGATRDTNSGDLARDLTAQGVHVLRATALPDDLQAVRDAFAAALREADLVVSSGGLGPTPDDLTREAIAAATGEVPKVDPSLEAWLRGLFERRGLEMPASNLKQAWLIAGATALANERGSAPGWFVERPDGRIIVALPGPPREMTPMWSDDALPRLMRRSLGVARVSRTLRLTGIGESAIVERIGEEILRAASPQVATYARADAVDLVVSAESAEPAEAARLVEEMVAVLRERVGAHVFAQGGQTWADALAARLGGRTLAVVEMGTAGQVQALLGSAEFLVHGELRRARDGGPVSADDLVKHAGSARESAGADVGLAVEAREERGDTRLHVAVVSASATHHERRVAFLAGEEGRRRAAIAACAVLWQWLASSDAASPYPP